MGYKYNIQEFPTIKFIQNVDTLDYTGTYICMYVCVYMHVRT